MGDDIVLDRERLARIHAAADGVPPPGDADVPHWLVDGSVRDPDTPPPPAPKWRRARDIVDTIIARASEPWVPLVLDGVPLAEVRPGGIVLVVGATGGGKTSLAASLLVEHAQRTGPAIGVSLELSGDEWVARSIGVRTGATWPAVLRGELSAGQMLGALPGRLAIVDRDQRDPLGACREAIEAMRREYPGEPILVAVDYAQIVAVDSDEEIRPRIGRVMRSLDALAREMRVVVLALSQGSRASSRVLRSGEATGAQTTDAGAESADLERWATLTLAIVGDSPPDEDGWARRGLAIGKSRMGAGDAEVPARYHGPSGRWEVVGEPRPAAEVRAEREAERESRRTTTTAHAIRDLLARWSEPMSRREIRGELGGTDTTIRAAVAALLDDQESGVVEVEPRMHGSYRVWTRDRAEAAGLSIRAREAS